MTVSQTEQEPQAQPGLIERGRYAITELPDGSWAIVRAGPLCQTCAGCGCGDQQDPITIPALGVNMLKAQQNGGAGLARLRAQAKAMMTRG